jgi:hypothetical protein
MRGWRVTLVLASVTFLVLLLSAPGAWRDAFERGEIYLFPWAFLADIPKRLTGPGKFRFLMQPAVAIVLGIRAGRADASVGRPPYLFALWPRKNERGPLLRSGLESVANLLFMGVLLDSVFQWLILGVSHPGAALVVGPVLIAVPYAVARALANRAGRRRESKVSLEAPR